MNIIKIRYYFVRLDIWESINFFSQKSFVSLHEKNTLLALKQ